MLHGLILGTVVGWPPAAPEARPEPPALAWLVEAETLSAGTAPAPQPPATPPPDAEPQPAPEQTVEPPFAEPAPEPQPALEQTAEPPHADEPPEKIEPPPEPLPQAPAQAEPGPPPEPTAPAARQTPPQICGRIVPVYPRRARRRGLEGSVTLALAISAAGTVESARVTVSSGHPPLDEAALQAARQATFLPATADSVAVAGEAQVTLTFRLAN